RRVLPIDRDGPPPATSGRRFDLSRARKAGDRCRRPQESTRPGKYLNRLEDRLARTCRNILRQTSGVGPRAPASDIRLQTSAQDGLSRVKRPRECGSRSPNSKPEVRNPKSEVG